MGKIKHQTITLSGIDLTIKSIEASDAAKLKPFWNQISQETTHTMRYPGEVLASEAELGPLVEKLYQDPKSLCLGLFTPTNLVGIGSFSLPYKNHPWYQHLGTFGIAITKPFWGRGLGQLILETIESYAQKRGILKIEAYVRADNLRALALYERMGYLVEGVRRKVVKIDQEFKNEVIIAKFL
jgi:RimJ/RimL family protein N-acetyltransferase